MSDKRTLWQIKRWEDLAAWAGQLGVVTGGREAWCIVDECLERDPIDCESGPSEEAVGMAARMAVRNADPQYRGYTPFGDI
jgi:hypothetical protein